MMMIGKISVVVTTTLLLVAVALAADRPHVVFIVADDLGRNDLGHMNGGKTITPAIDQLMEDGIFLDSYYTFKICSPTRSSILTGRYPWGAGFYDMAQDENHCTKNYTLMSTLMQNAGYRTHAIGKWDVGFMEKACSPTYRGFETFLGYYTACIADYWYHTAPMSCAGTAQDFSFNEGSKIGPADPSTNGTYDRDVFSDRAAQIITQHDESEPLFLYLAFQNVHLACGKGRDLGIQAPCELVEKYPNAMNDTYKLQSALVTELDQGVGAVVDILKAKGMWNNTLIVLVSDNGGPLDHSTNYPLRGGKHTFWEGGLRVVSFVSGPVVPQERRGSIYYGMAHSSDWYPTLVEGFAGSTIPDNTGPRAPDGFNIKDALFGNLTSPRTEVVHQVENQYFSEGVTAIRRGNFKLIQGNPGCDQIIAFPTPSATPVPFGQSGGVKESGTNHCRAPPGKQCESTRCEKHCLFNVVSDPGETTDLSTNPAYQQVIAQLQAALVAAGQTGGPPAYLYPNVKEYKNKSDELCTNMAKTGVLEPLDLDYN